MAHSDTIDHRSPWIVVCDVMLILAISLVAAAAHFSVKQGQAVICGDSAQHMDGAEALLTDGKTPNFGFRKPGYTFLLAAIGRVAGNMSWAAVATNHVFLAFVPLAAYGLGLNLRSRLAGWVAAILTVAQLQVAPMAERIMSEPFYTCLLSFSALVFVVGLSRRRVGRWMLAAGLLLALAWLTRALAAAVIAAAVVCILWNMRSAPKRALTACACLLLPVMGAVLVESGLNLVYSGRFRTSTGSLGVMLTTRARYFQGSAFADTHTARKCLALLPERDPHDAYRVDNLDGCIARCHAIREQGMDEWEFNDLLIRAGLEMIVADPKAYLAAGLDTFVRHILRQKGQPQLAHLPREQRHPIVVHPDATSFRESQDYWYAYWFMPYRSVEESVDLVSRMRVAAKQRAWFGGSGIWAALRYGGMHTTVVDGLGVLRGVATLWPGFAIIFCGLLGLNRRTCAFLAAAYVLEALLIAACGCSDVANERYQAVWLATDTALAAVIVAPAAELAFAPIARWYAALSRSAAGHSPRRAGRPGV